MNRETPRRHELDADLHRWLALAYRAKARGVVLALLASLLLTATVLRVSHWLVTISERVERLRVALEVRPQRLRRASGAGVDLAPAPGPPFHRRRQFFSENPKIMRFRHLGRLDEKRVNAIWRKLLRPRVHSLPVDRKSPLPSGRAASLGLSVLKGQAGSQRMLDPRRTLEVQCGNCRAKFRAWYGASDSGLQTIHVNRCGLCEGDPLMKLMYKGCGLQLVARVTNRGIRKTIGQLR